MGAASRVADRTDDDREAAAAILRDLLGARLVLVTGKGGTGKTTFSAALALLAAAKGRKVLLAEIDSQRPALTPVFGQAPTFDGVAVTEHLTVANLTWQDALQAFLRKLVPSRRIVKLILTNRVVSRFLDFTPGSQEIVTLSALGERVESYDLVVADMPASGHAFSLLDITRSAMGLFRSGPVRTRASELRALLIEPSTRVALVGLPEEMVVNETIETYAKLDKFGLLSRAPAVFLNRATLPTFTDDERSLLARLGKQELTELQEEFLRAGRWEDELEQATASSRHRLAEAIPIRPVLVPPSTAGGTSAGSVQAVAAHLGRLVGIGRKQLGWPA
ncbi:MAG: AAA family ATPase [Myxococcales bacterium]|nr:AAA family ATPase [Myxococcales bacterium]